MSKQEMTLAKLHTDLKHFGLNPQEWTLKKIHALKFLVQNKKDTTFALHGRLEYQNKRPHWKALTLSSI